MNLEGVSEDILVNNDENLLYAKKNGFKVQGNTDSALILSRNFWLLKKEKRVKVQACYVLSPDETRLVIPKFPVNFFVSFQGGCHYQDFRDFVWRLHSSRLSSVGKIPNRCFPRTWPVILLNNQRGEQFPRISTADIKLEDALYDLSQTYNFAPLM